MNRMLEASQGDELPVMLQLDDLKDFSFRDLQDLFIDFSRDTDLDIYGHLHLCEECGKMHLQLEVDHPEEKPKKILQ